MHFCHIFSLSPDNNVMRSVELFPTMPNTVNNDNMLAAEIGIDNLGLSKPAFSPLFLPYTFPH